MQEAQRAETYQGQQGCPIEAKEEVYSGSQPRSNNNTAKQATTATEESRRTDTSAELTVGKVNKDRSRKKLNGDLKIIIQNASHGRTCL